MQIHEAALQTTVTWQITKYPQGWVIEVKDFDITAPYDETVITKQRGGVRFFKTCDAALNALEKIGQKKVMINVDCFS